MAGTPSIKREYNKSDDLMLEQAQTMHNLLEADLADFTAEYISINAAYLADFQTAIDEAYAMPSATEEYNELELLTENVEALMTQSRQLYQKLSSYIKLIYPNSKAIHNIFYADEYVSVRRSQPGMIRLLGRCYEKANSAPYKAALIAEGFLQLDIDQLEALREDLFEANEAQEKLAKELLLKTEERIKKYNLVWAFMQKTSATSKQVYVDSPAKQEMYLLYPETQGPSVPSKVQNLSYDLLGTKVKWDVAVGAQSYELQQKIDMPSADFLTIYEGALNEYVYTPPVGVWLFRCRGENDAGKGNWSNEYQWIQE